VVDGFIKQVVLMHGFALDGINEQRKPFDRSTHTDT
jgi:hypothetical protein